MGTDMRMVVQAVSGTDGSWYALGDLLPERNYDAYAWYGRLGTGPVGGLSALALRGLPDDEEPAWHADRFGDELGYGHSWCYLDELQREHARPAVVEQWVKRLLSDDLGKSVTNRDPETLRPCVSCGRLRIERSTYGRIMGREDRTLGARVSGAH